MKSSPPDTDCLDNLNLVATLSSILAGIYFVAVNCSF